MRHRMLGLVVGLITTGTLVFASAASASFQSTRVAAPCVPAPALFVAKPPQDAPIRLQRPEDLTERPGTDWNELTKLDVSVSGFGVDMKSGAVVMTLTNGDCQEETYLPPATREAAQHLFDLWYGKGEVYVSPVSMPMGRPN